MAGGSDCDWDLRHSLAFAPILYRECLINRVSIRRVAARFHLDPEEATGVWRLLRAVGHVPSPERLALIAMRDPGLECSDVDEMFGKPSGWAESLAGIADQLRQDEPIPEECEWLCEDLTPDMPCPDEIDRITIEIRTEWPRTHFRNGVRPGVVA